MMKLYKREQYTQENGLKRKKPSNLLSFFAVRTGLEPATLPTTSRDNLTNRTTEFLKTKKAQQLAELFCGPDGTRTRDPLRDRQVF